MNLFVMSAYAVLIVALSAVAGRSHASHSGHRCVATAWTLTTLPDPFTIDPEDVGAILAFIDDVVSFGAESRENALKETLRAFWMKYRPDLDAAALGERLAILRASKFGLQVIRRDDDARLIEMGRLRMVWLGFLGDVARPSDPPPSLAVWHRARALSTPRRASHIVRFVGEAMHAPVPGDREAVAHLWQQFGPPGVSAPDLSPVKGAQTPGHQIKGMWSAYVRALAAERGQVRRRARPLVRRHPSLPPAAARVEDVPAEALAILAFLMARYPDVTSGDPDGLPKLIEAVRCDHGLNMSERGRIPLHRRFKRWDLRTALYDLSDRARQRVVAAWMDFLHDLAKTRSKKQKAPRSK